MQGGRQLGLSRTTMSAGEKQRFGKDWAGEEGKKSKGFTTSPGRSDRKSGEAKAAEQTIPMTHFFPFSTVPFSVISSETRKPV